MRRILTFVMIFLGFGALHSCSATKETPAEAPFEVHWSVENLGPDSTGRHYRQSLRLVGDLRGVERLAFNQFARRMTPSDPADTIIEIVPGYYALGSSRFAGADGSDTLDVDIVTSGALYSLRYAPEGFHAVMADGRVLPVRLVQADILADPRGYTSGSRDYMPYGDAVYARNEEIAGGTAGMYDVVPSFKEVRTGAGSSVVDLDNIEFAEPAEAPADGEYRVTVGEGRMRVEAPRAMWPRLRLRLRHNFGNGRRELPDAVITDRPSLEYRGLMVDVARNFQQPEEIHRVLDMMAVYGLNTFHFHLVDDEAWRLEIPPLPELTEMGGRRGYTPGSDGTFLPQIFGGDGNPASATSNNGYISRADYIGIIRHADSLGIAVIPEIESPGHGRAAIRAMELRARRTGDNSLLMSEAADTSRYTSAQSFHDNVMNPALEGTYKLMNTVADEIAAMHREAGVPLKAIHIGGDEVPRGAWSGSPAVAAMMEREGLTTEKEVHAAFVRRVASDFAAKGIAISGWQEIALRHPEDYNEAVRPHVYSVNCWSTLASQGAGGVVEAVAKADYPVVLSNVNHFYLDMCYSRHPHERGLTWGGTTDEFSALAGYPARLCPFEGANLKGVQGQVFAETIRDRGNLETMLFPKMLGLAERGWNPDSTYSDADFHAVILREIPKWEAAGLTYHVRQPGLVVEDGCYVKVNSPYPDAVVRVSFDGSDPDENSPELKPGEVFDLTTLPEAPKQIRARLWLNGHPSVATLARPVQAAPGGEPGGE